MKNTIKTGLAVFGGLTVAYIVADKVTDGVSSEIIKAGATKAVEYIAEKRNSLIEAGKDIIDNTTVENPVV